MVTPTWTESTSNLGVYMSLALPATLMLVLDWWIWEFMVLISGYLGVQ